jgi:hypothetical protein
MFPKHLPFIETKTVVGEDQINLICRNGDIRHLFHSELPRPVPKVDTRHKEVGLNARLSVQRDDAPLLKALGGIGDIPGESLKELRDSFDCWGNLRRLNYRRRVRLI